LQPEEKMVNQALHEKQLIMANAEGTLYGTMVERDSDSRRIRFARHFDAVPERVWETWSDARELEKWWAPKPYKVETKAFNFQPGGRWHYVMGGPNNERYWASLMYNAIEAPLRFEATAIFTDDVGNREPGSPQTYWHVEVSKALGGTLLEVIVTDVEPGALARILRMGFEAGFKEGLDNLEDLLL
jgi:uncharacterized protein YndB with AHSA1/START domain